MSGIHVTHIIDSLRIGGAQRLLLIFAELAAQHQIETRVISLYSDQDLTITEALRDLGVTVVAFPGRHLLSPGRFFRLARYLRQQQCELRPRLVVHTHLTYANALGIPAGRLAGLPVVATLHSTGHAGHRLHPAAEGLERWALRVFASRVIAVGNTVAQAYRSVLGQKEIALIPNAVGDSVVLSLQERQELRRQIAGDPNRMILISVGRFIPAKAYHDLVAAFARVHADHPEAMLAIVGGGPLFAGIQEQVNRLGLQGHVCLPGSRNDVPRWLAASDLYVSASIWEGLPLSILEAMMAGLPVVATSVGDIPYVVTAEMGQVVPPHRPDLLAEAIHGLLAEPASRQKMGSAAQAQAKMEYAAEIWMDRLVLLYREVLPLLNQGSRMGFKRQARESRR